ncbi:MAG: hypothetical protein DMD67_01550 [Gemmatimonadetes bacterium]|nr:MAG: hypothetical protein DMD67_01550 [Gemmatimonadota bacterium]
MAGGGDPGGRLRCGGVGHTDPAGQRDRAEERGAAVHGDGARRCADLCKRQRGALASLQGADPRGARGAAVARRANHPPGRGDRSRGSRRLRTGVDDGRGAAQSPLHPPGAAHGNHVPRQIDHAYLAEGKRVYYQNCLPCHGDHLDGQGHFAHGFNPIPANFQDNGTIAQLTESFVFWRVAKGGPGLPREGTPWNSAMPKWEDFLTEREIWSVILFLYDQTGWTPRTWEKTGSDHD